MRNGSGDLHQTPEWADFMRKIGWVSETLPATTCQVFIKKLPVVGSIIKILRPASLNLNEIDKIAHKNRALFLKVEPALTGVSPQNLLQNGFLPDNWPLCATRVYRIGLEDSLEGMMVRFSKDARYSIHRAERNGITVDITPLINFKKDHPKLRIFYQLFKHTGEKKGFWVPPRRELEAKAVAFAKKSYLVLAKFGEDYVSGAFVIVNGNTAYYEHAAANALGRKLLAQYLVVWETIKLAKEKGCQILDLGGIADPRFKISRRWQGLEVFKAKFGGEIVTYPSSYTKYYNPLIKFLFKLNF